MNNNEWNRTKITTRIVCMSIRISGLVSACQYVVDEVFLESYLLSCKHTVGGVPGEELLEWQAFNCDCLS